MVNQVLTSLVRQEAKSPVMWMALLAAAVAWPISLHYSPLTTTLGSTTARDLAYDIAYLLALFGALYSDKKLASAGWILSRLTPGRRDVLYLGVIGAGAFAPCLLSLLPLSVLEGTASVPNLATMALISLHMAALTLSFKAVGFSYSERSVGLLFLAVALPASILVDTGPLGLPWRVLDPAAAGELGSANLLLNAHHVGSIVGLTLFAQYFGLRSMRQR